jgi:hypothetical protein
MRIASVQRVRPIHAAHRNADLPGVPASPAFETVLDEKLHEVGGWAGVAARCPSSSVTMPDPALLASLWTGSMANPFGIRAFAGQAWSPVVTDAPPASAPGSRRVGPAAGPHTGPPVAAPQRPMRPDKPRVILAIANMQQRQALAEFVEAGIAPDARQVALDDLKAAYRTLARTYHPDRHLGASEPVRAHCGARFARIAAAYSLLVASTLPHG